MLVAFIWLVHVSVAQSPEPKFEYVNIRFETNTPEEHYKNIIGGTDPGTDPGTNPGTDPGTDLPILDRASSNDATTTTDTNPFSNVADTTASEDLSKFSKTELESRRDLLLAILEQTSAQLEESSTTLERANPLVNNTKSSVEETKATKSENHNNSETMTSQAAQEYIPQKATRQEQSLLKKIMGDSAFSATSHASKAVPWILSFLTILIISFDSFI